MRNDRKRKEEPNNSTERGKAFSAVGTRHVFGNVIRLKPTDRPIRKSLGGKMHTALEVKPVTKVGEVWITQLGYAFSWI